MKLKWTCKRYNTDAIGRLLLVHFPFQGYLTVKYFSLFSGIGGFEAGIHKALSGRKAHCVGFSEIYPYAIKTYATHFPKHRNFGDITKIKAKQLPNFELLVGGFPCQSFSIAGERRGFDDPRGQMFHHIVRILRAKRPSCFILENVTGLLNHDGGRTFKVIIAALAAVGYRVQWLVLDSQNHGVPQHRERVFIIGHHRSIAQPKIFPHGFADIPTRATHQAKHRSGIQQLFEGGYASKRIYGVNGVSPALVSSATTIPMIAVTNSSNREFGWRTISPTLCAGDFRNIKLVAEYSEKGYKNVRHLTPLEYERLQGFDDHWTAGLSDNQRYKCLGNAVTIPVIAWLVKQAFKKT